MRAWIPRFLMGRAFIAWTKTLAGPMLFLAVALCLVGGAAGLGCIPWLGAILLLPGLLLASMLALLGWAITSGADAPQHWGWGAVLGLGGAVLGFVAEIGGLRFLAWAGTFLGTGRLGAIGYAVLLALLLVQPFILASGYFAGRSTWRWACRIRERTR